jgi:hypothetical protein
MSRLDEIRAAVSEPALRLAYHAALPVVVDPALLHLLRVNFFLDPPDAVDYDDEAALLLSPLFREVSEGLYEIEPELRDALLSGLYTRYGPERVRRVAALLERYTEASPAWRALPSLEAAQRLTAVSFLDPDEARRWLAASEASMAASGTAENGPAGSQAGETAPDSLSASARLGREWHVAMRRRVEEQSAVRGFDEEIERAKALLYRMHVDERMKGVAALGTLARHPEGEPERVVRALCQFVTLRCDGRGGQNVVSEDVQAALTLIGTLPYAGRRELRNITLCGAIISGLDFSRTTFVRVSFIAVKATGTDLTHAVLEDCHMDDVVLDGARLDGAFLGLLSMRHVSMRRVSDQDTVYSWVDIEDVVATDLSDAPNQLLTGQARSAPEGDAADPVASAAASYIQDLRELRDRVGRPTYRRMEYLNGHAVAASTMATMLGSATKLPSWRRVQGFVAACHAAALEDGIDVGPLGTVADWQRRWVEADLQGRVRVPQHPRVTPLLRSDPVRVGRYELTGRLGSGGMGTVFLGTSPAGRMVAVKVMRPELADDEEFRGRFARQVAAARHADGMRTAPVVDADPDANPPWLATGYIPGQPLDVRVASRGRLSAPEVRDLAKALAEGLAAIHQCGLVHRDLKPSNIILAEDGPRIIGFGIPQDAVMNTPAFMSPEQVAGAPAGPQSDVFALGSVLVYAATGRGPFDEGPATTMHRITSEPPDLSGLGGLSAPLRDLIFFCLQKKAADRPTPAEIIARLAR